MDDLSGRLGITTNNHYRNVSSKGGVHEDEESEDGRDWKTMFEEGMESSDINDGVLEDGCLDHVRTQWRYDYAFTTPSGSSGNYRFASQLLSIHQST